jgi:formylglycine-generating enzyme required for sulfatase activity
VSNDQREQKVGGQQVNIDEMHGDIGHIGDSIDTGGGAYVQGDVHAGGDFVGGDKHVHVYQNPTKPAIPVQRYEPETVLIPAGPFIMGDDDNPDTAPQHSVFLPAFRIGLYPVTNEQLAQFIWMTKGRAGKALLWEGNRPPSGEENYPVTGVTWYEAMAYCQWLHEQTGRDYTLPSEAQWEKAARSEDGRLYPWGNDWDPSRCNDDPDSLAAVDQYDVQSPYGCYDMVGNAREWTTTLWDSSAPRPGNRFRYPWAEDGRDDSGAPATTWRVYRGGRSRSPERFRCAVREGYPPSEYGPKRNRHGFRVACLLGGSYGT